MSIPWWAPYLWGALLVAGVASAIAVVRFGTGDLLVAGAFGSLGAFSLAFATYVYLDEHYDD